jgi:YhcH/YjgK/YiaL family protein
MILSTLSQAHHYHFLGGRFVAGFDWLTQFQPTLEDGRHEIDGDNVFALVQSYTTQVASGKQFETHRNYADIQYLAAGDEVIPYAPTGALTAATEYNAERDFMLYTDPRVSTPLRLTPGAFAIFLPHDGHKPGCVFDLPCPVRKVVIKVRL